jgi:ribulose-5-phosphate 4-epimerase/fuculose-1-phosphate aldolase
MGNRVPAEAAIAGIAPGPAQMWFLNGLEREMMSRGYRFRREFPERAPLVLNVIDAARPRPFHRQTYTTYVIAVAEADEPPQNVLGAAYPLLVRAIANLVIYVVPSVPRPRVYYVTPEQGCYEIPACDADETFFARAFDELVPLATSTLVIDNELIDDLPESIRLGDPIPNQIRQAGERLDRMGLLPAPFPVEELLSPDDLRRVRLLYGIGGLSYGNVSARSSLASGFWMTATGVDKGRLGEAGRDILLVDGYEFERRRIRVRVSPKIRPRHASVDAIEHAMIYEEHSEIGAIVHVHSWIDAVPATEINYPCGTYELARAVSDVIRSLPDPTRGIVGLKNHGVTITGPSLDDIFSRIDGKLLPRVPSLAMRVLH